MNPLIHSTIANMGGLFSGQGIFIFTILLLFFGAKRLPELAKGLGQAIKEFSKAKNELTDEISRPPMEETRHIAATPITPVTPVIPPSPIQPASGIQTHETQQAPSENNLSV